MERSDPGQLDFAAHRARRSERRVDPFVFRLVDFRAGGIRRLLRGVVGDAGAAYAADVGHQRDLLGDRRRRLLAVGVALVGDDGGSDLGARASASSRSTFASVNIFGGFLVTQRMLAMYQEERQK